VGSPVDVAFVGVVDVRFYVIEKHRGFKLPDDGPVWARFKEWVEATTKRESVWRTRSEEKYYEQVPTPLSTLLICSFMRDI
jgi:hypothetical protein